MSDLPTADDVELAQQLSDVVKQLTILTEKVTLIEQKLTLIPDLDRYGKLQRFLAAGDFRSADLETSNVILESAVRTRDTFTPEDMKQFPCNILQVIDRLWRTYSHDRFGFSVQLELYQKAGGNTDTLRSQNAQALANLGDTNGWRIDGKWQGDNYENWDFTLSAPHGCFPAVWWKSPYGLKMANFCFLRIIECNLSKN